MNGCELGHHLQGAAHSFPLVLQDQLYRTWALKPLPPQLQTADKRQSSWLQNSPAQQGLVSQSMAAAGLWPTQLPEPYLDSREGPELPLINVD